MRFFKKLLVEMIADRIKGNIGALNNWNTIEIVILFGLPDQQHIGWSINSNNFLQQTVNIGHFFQIFIAVIIASH